jgi:hypothetical protein
MQTCVANGPCYFAGKTAACLDPAPAGFYDTDRPKNNFHNWVACSHDAKRRVSMEITTASSMPTRGKAA